MSPTEHDNLPDVDALASDVGAAEAPFEETGRGPGGEPELANIIDERAGNGKSGPSKVVIGVAIAIALALSFVWSKVQLSSIEEEQAAAQPKTVVSAPIVPTDPDSEGPSVADEEEMLKKAEETLSQRGAPSLPEIPEQGVDVAAQLEPSAESAPVVAGVRSGDVETPATSATSAAPSAGESKKDYTPRPLLPPAPDVVASAQPATGPTDLPVPTARAPAPKLERDRAPAWDPYGPPVEPRRTQSVVSTQEPAKPRSPSGLAMRPDVQVLMVAVAGGCSSCTSVANLLVNGKNVTVAEGDSLLSYRVKIAGDRVVLANAAEQHTYVPKRP